jgi:hypothetical protein
MIKSIGDNYGIYGLIIVKIKKTKSLMLDHELSKTTFEPANHAFTFLPPHCASSHDATFTFIFYSLHIIVACDNLNASFELFFC